MISSLLCSLGLAFTAGLIGPSEAVCISPEAAQEAGMGHAAGWYDGYEDRIYVLEGQGLQYTMEVVAHEAAHAEDLRMGTALNGYPSFFSETHTGFDIEEYARMVTLVRGWWPSGEAFPDEWAYLDRASSDVALMEAAGWIPKGIAPLWTIGEA